MAKNSITDYSKTASSNTDIQSVDIDEGCLPSGINNAIRELMADLADMNDGTVTLTSPSFAAASLTGNLSFGDDDKAIFGAGSDLQIFHNSGDNSSYIKELGAGDLKILGDNVRIMNSAGTENQIFAASNAGVYLYHDNAAKLETTSTGIDVTGTVTADGLTVDKTATISTTDYYASSTFSGTLKGAASNTKAALLLNSISSSGQNAFASLHSEPIADFRSSLIATYSADGSGAGYFAVNQFIPTSSNTSERLRIDSSGNVGIGTSSPDSQLELSKSSTSNYTALKISNTSTSGAAGRLTFENTLAAGTFESGHIRGATNSFGNGGLIFEYNTSGTATGATEAMRITDAGLVGIGTTSPDGALHVKDTIAQVYIQSNDGQPSQIVFGDASDASRGRINYDSSDNIIFENNNLTERMRIDSFGRVGIGTSSPNQKLNVSGGRSYFGASNEAYAIGVGYNGTRTAANQTYFIGATDATAPDLQFSNADGGEKVRITHAGNVGIGTSSPTGKLDVYTSANRFQSFTSASADLEIVTDNNTNPAVLIKGTGNADLLNVFDNTTEVFTIVDGGSVGIGNANPQNKLDIEQSAAVSARLLATGATSSSVKLEVKGGATQLTTTEILANSSGAMTFATGTTSSTERMRISDDGILLMGRTTSPSAAGAKIAIGGTGDTAVQITKDGVVAGRVMAVTTGLAFGVDGADGATERMRIDSSGNVGIGTTSPAVELHINDASGLSAIRLTGGASGADNFQIMQGVTGVSNSGLSIYDVDATATRMVINSSGNVGIGTSSPSSKVEIYDTQNTQLRVNTASHGYLDLSNYTNGAGVMTSAAHPLRLGTANTERMRIDSSGNTMLAKSSTNTLGTVGHDFGVTGYAMHTRASSNVLYLNRTTNDGNIAEFYKDGATVGSIGTYLGDAYVGTGAAGLRFYDAGPAVSPHNTTTNVGTDATVDLGTSAGRFKSLYLSSDLVLGAADGYVFGNTNGVNIRASSGKSTIFDTAGSERMRITSGGRIGIGTSSPSGTLHLKTIRYDNYPIFQTTSDSFTPFFINFQKTDGTTIGSIRMTGTTGVAFNTTSDYRLKENVTGISDGIERVKQLNPSRFNFISDAGITVDGFLAHEAQTVVPQAVTGEKDAVDEDGNPEYQSIDHSKLVPLLTAALQEAIAKIEDLEERVATLEGN